MPPLNNLKLERTAVGGPLPSEMGLLSLTFNGFVRATTLFTGLIPSQLGLLTGLNGRALGSVAPSSTLWFNLACWRI